MILSTPTTLAVFSWLGVASAQYYAITGVHDGVGTNGSRPARLNINTLQKDSYAWPLYIQALAAMQNISQNAQTSYFQIAGIHGRPYYSWNNVSGQFDYTGYCTHESVLFPTWHRPYLALFEQELNSHAQMIAHQYYGPNKTKYMAAARALRMPYWDWAESAAIPTILNTAKITIITPTGKQQVDNPLYAYAFPLLETTYFPNQDAYDSYLANDSTTVRDPNASANLMNAQLTPATYNLFTHTPVYENFSTQSISGTSLEAVHGTVHVYVGGNYGHMTQLSYAAFDPIFWLHHCNVDRIFALWQAIYPDLFIPAEGLNDDYGTYTIAPGTIEYSTDPLTPFTSSTTGTMYTSDTSRDLKTWGYTYPEISDWNQTKAQLSAAVTAKVNALYNPSGAYSRRKRHARDLSSIQQYEFFVNIEVSKSDLQSSAVVLLFDGAPPADTTTWRGASNLIGSLFVPMPPNHSTGGTKRYTHGEVPLKEALAKSGFSNSSKGAIITYLTDNLEWRVQNVDGTVVDLSSCPSLKIRVQDEEVTSPEDEHSFPTYGNPTAHPEITEGKIGGFEAADSE